MTAVPFKQFKEENYNTVLGRIFFRAKVNDKWVNLSLKGGLKKQEQLKDWLSRYLLWSVCRLDKDTVITEKKMREIVRLFDELGMPPVRLRDGWDKKETR